MSKILVIAAHPNIEQSLINKLWITELSKENLITIQELYKAYPNEEINVLAEQKLVEVHDIIIFQFPFYHIPQQELQKASLSN